MNTTPLRSILTAVCLTVSVLIAGYIATGPLTGVGPGSASVMAAVVTPGRRISRLARTCDRYGVTDMTLRRWERDGKFPMRVKLNLDGPKTGAVGHFEDELDAHDERLRAARDAAENRAATRARTESDLLPTSLAAREQSS